MQSVITGSCIKRLKFITSENGLCFTYRREIVALYSKSRYFQLIHQISYIQLLRMISDEDAQKSFTKRYHNKFINNQISVQSNNHSN